MVLQPLWLFSPIEQSKATSSARRSAGAAKKLFEESEKRSRKVDAADRKSARKEAKGTLGNVTLWTKDEAVTKYEIRLTGKIDVDGKETEGVRTRTIELKEVGTTTIELPEKARRKLGL